VGYRSCPCYRNTYDSKGNLIGVTPPSPLGSESFTYDGLSRVISSTDGKGQTTTYTYNNLNKLTKITYADGSSVSYTYDADNNLITEVDSTGTTTFTYDALNGMTGKSLPNGTTISYTYDKVGNLLTYTDAGGTVTYGYNAVNLPTTITDPSGAKTTYNYDADVDKMTSIAYPNGITTSYTYDDDRHVTSIVAKNSSGTSLMSFTYTYHGDLVSTVTDLNNNKTTYSYDALNRLTEAVTDNSSGVQTAKYEYPLDGAGNILAIKLNGVTTNTLTYNAANELVSNVGSSTINYTYDADGNLTSDGTLNYIYNAANQTTGIGTDTYSYTGPDQTDRVQANNTSYTYGSLGLGSATTSGSSVYYTRDSSGKLISERTPTGTYYYLTNNIGSVILVTDSTGKVQNSYSYDPLGNSLGKTESVVNPWQFAGGYLDATTGLYKFGTRYYNPTVGRWTQPDPKGGNITDINSLARYAYADDDPINLTDPSGRATWWEVWGNCMSLGVEAPLLWIGNILMGISGLGAVLITLGVITTAPVWLAPALAWTFLAGLSIIVGVGLACAYAATFEYNYSDN